MAALDFIIDEADVNNSHVEAQPTILQGTPSENKKVFDKYCDMIVTHFNQLCSFIDSDKSATISNEVLALFMADGWTPEN